MNAVAERRQCRRRRTSTAADNGEEEETTLRGISSRMGGTKRRRHRQQQAQAQAAQGHSDDGDGSSADSRDGDEYRPTGTADRPRRMRRRRPPTTSLAAAVLGGILVAASILLSLHRTTTVSAQQPMRSCFRAFNRADDDYDGVLTEAEFVAAVRTLTNDALDTEDFSEYPASLSGAYTSRAQQQGGGGVPIVREDENDDNVATPERVAAAQDFCEATYDGILDALGLTSTINSSICFRALALGDTSRDDALSEAEYARFLSTLSGGAVPASTSYMSLAAPLQAVYNDFKGDSTGTVNVKGSKPGQSSTVDAAKLEFLLEFCEHAAVGVAAAAAASTDSVPVPAPPQPSPEAPQPAPAAAPQPSGPTTPSTPAAPSPSDFSPSFTLTQCTNAMAFSDLSRNGDLNKDEYLRFINRLTSNEYLGQSFSTLPQPLQDNYDQLADENGVIEIAGSRPGQTPTAEEAAHLTNVCTSTDKAIQSKDSGGGGDGPTPTPPSEPTAPTPEPPSQPSAPTEPKIELEYLTCTRYMALSDISRDDELNQVEYVRFVNMISGNQWQGVSYADLPQPLRSNFDALAADVGGIDVTGSKPYQSSSVTPEQTAHLENFCQSTAEAINGAISPPGPTFPPQNSTVYNAYIISNQDGLMAADLRIGSTRQALDDSYELFVTNNYDEFLQGLTGQRRLSASRSRRRRLRRRLQQANIELLAGQIETYLIVDEDCPTNVTGTCQKVYGKFGIQLTNVNNTNMVVNALTKQTQAAIAQGGLQASLDATDPDSPLDIVGATTPTQPPQSTPAPTPAPGPAPTPDGGGGGGGSGGKAAGAVIAVLLVIGIGVGGWYYKKRGGTCPGFLAGGGGGGDVGKKDNKTVEGDGGDPAFDDDMDDDDEGFGQFRQSAPQNTIGSSSLYVDDEDASGAEFSIDESESNHGPGHGVRGSNVFGAFGLKGKKKGSGMDDSIGDLQTGDIEDNPANEFADYAFDDPVAEFDDAQDKDDGGLHEIFGSAAAKSAPTFGQDDGWGAEGGDHGWKGDQPGYENDGDGNASYDSRESGSDDESDYDQADEDERTRGASTIDAPENMRHLDSMVEQGNWDGVMAAATKFGDTEDYGEEEGSTPSRPSLQESEGSSQSQSQSSADDFEEKQEAPAFDFDEGGAEGGGEQGSHWSYTSEELRRRNQYRGQVESLVRKVAPEDIDNVSAMLDQFAGREAELINTLQTMQERSSAQRARKAVHKSKGVPQRDNPAFAGGGIDGSAAIAAASTLGVQNFDEPDDGGDFEPDYGYGEEIGEDEDSRSRSYDEDYDEEYPESGSFDGDSRSGSQSYSGSHSDRSGSQYSGGSPYSQEDQPENFDGDSRSGSHSYSGSHSDRSGSQYGDEGSQYSGQEEELSYRSGSASGSGSYSQGSQYSGKEEELSYRSGSASGSGSYSQRSGSQFSGGEEEGSFHSGSFSQESGSQYSGEGSDRSGSFSDDRSGSQVSGDADEGSYHSGSYSQGSGSQFSREEGSYHRYEKKSRLLLSAGVLLGVAQVDSFLSFSAPFSPICNPVARTMTRKMTEAGHTTTATRIAGKFACDEHSLIDSFLLSYLRRA